MGLRALLIALALPTATFCLLPEASANVFRLTDRDGVTHITNAPTDPRYRLVPGMTGTRAGWLRVPPETRVRYAEEIREISARHGVKAALVEAVIRAESAFNPWAVSRKGARGLMQLMPQTASSLGVKNSFDPRQNIEGGVRHLRYLLDRYGNLPLALAAYNAGEAAVDHYRGIPPYQETQQYVQKVLYGGGAGGGVGGRPFQAVYRHMAADGTVTYSNIPPTSHLRLTP